MALAAALAQVAKRKFEQWRFTRRLVATLRRAGEAESRAARILTRAGYAVIGSQVPTRYTLWIDDKPLSIGLRADYIVRQRGRVFVAEVKSGKFAPNLQTVATRRQLLEYRMAFGVDGVLLVDAETDLIHQIVFEGGSAPPEFR